LEAGLCRRLNNNNNTINNNSADLNHKRFYQVKGGQFIRNHRNHNVRVSRISMDILSSSSKISNKVLIV
jgi:hypothetical protein